MPAIDVIIARYQANDKISAIQQSAMSTINVKVEIYQFHVDIHLYVCASSPPCQPLTYSYKHITLPMILLSAVFHVSYWRNCLQISIKWWYLYVPAVCYIRVITKLPNSEQSYKGKVKTHKYINRQNQYWMPHIKVMMIYLVSSSLPCQ